MASRDKRGRFWKEKKRKQAGSASYLKNLTVEHNYSGSNYCIGPDCAKESCWCYADIPATAKRDSWRQGRRFVEFGVLLDNLRSCSFCQLGPIPLTHLNVVGEMQKGLGGFLYVRCENPDCREVNRVAYGKMHRNKRTGMSCFSVNTKLGMGM